MKQHIGPKRYLVLGLVLIVQVVLVVVAKLFFFPQAVPKGHDDNLDNLTAP